MSAEPSAMFAVMSTWDVREELLRAMAAQMHARASLLAERRRFLSDRAFADFRTDEASAIYGSEAAVLFARVDLPGGEEMSVALRRNVVFEHRCGCSETCPPPERASHLARSREVRRNEASMLAEYDFLSRFDHPHIVSAFSTFRAPARALSEAEVAIAEGRTGILAR